MFSNLLHATAHDLLHGCKAKGLTLATAESCTGGLIAALLTSVPGSSCVFERGFVTYSNASKTQMLGVDAALIETHGAVSEQVAVAMASGAREKAKVDIAVSVTGIAGPDGGSNEKPVGTVCIGIAHPGGTQVATHRFTGDRDTIRMQSVEAALSMVEKII